MPFTQKTVVGFYAVDIRPLVKFGQIFIELQGIRIDCIPQHDLPKQLQIQQMLRK